MKFIILLTTLIFSQAQAIRVVDNTKFVLECAWQDSVNQYSPGYYRPAGFKLYFKDDVFYVTQDSYFIRRYEPCWVGNYSSCYFSFGDAAYKPYVIEESTSSYVRAEKSGGYYDPVLEMTFNKNFYDLQDGQTVRMSLFGDDNDGTFINDDSFVCTKRKHP